MQVDEKFKMPARRAANLGSGALIHPHDACYGKDGNIFVVEWVLTGRVTKLRKVS